MAVLESWKYGDPAEFMDRQRKETEREKQKKARIREMKHRRIQALTKKAMEGRR